MAKTAIRSDPLRLSPERTPWAERAASTRAAEHRRAALAAALETAAEVVRQRRADLDAAAIAVDEARAAAAEHAIATAGGDAPPRGRP